MKLPPQVAGELGRVGLLLLGAVLAGSLLGAVTAVVCVALLGYLAITLLQLAQLERRLEGGWRRAEHEAPAGLWRAIDGHLLGAAARQRKHRRDAARNLRLFRAATAALPDAIVALDPGWGIQWANPAATVLLGLEMPRDIGQHIGNLVRNPAFTAAVAGPGPYEPIEMPAPRSPERWLSVVVIEYGTGLRLMIARDATRLRRLEQMRREFVANASHELRSPLTVIAGYVDAMAEDPALAGPWSGPLAEMRRQTARMTGIVGDLLELSRLETDAREPPHDPVDVRGLLTRIRDEALALGDGPRDLQLVIEDAAGMLGSERELHSAFSNLIFNAMRYTPGEGRVTVQWARDGEGLRLTVRDTGVGIPAEHLPRLTERFYRVDPSRSRTKGGTGLGLAIVKHVVQRHGGTLGIESEVGKGSVFTARFPANRRAFPSRR